jgi:hypothetical protein
MCAICWTDPNTGRRGTNSTTKICAACKSDPINRGWRESWENFYDDLDHFQASTTIDLYERKARQQTAVQRAIIDLLTRGEREVYIYVDKRGRRRGRRERTKYLSYTEIADRVGCSRVWVFKVVKKYLAG